MFYDKNHITEIVLYK